MTVRFKAKGKSRAKKTILLEKDVDARHVQRLGDFSSNTFEKRAGLNDGADFVAETGENLLRIVGIAEKAAVCPRAKPKCSPAEQENGDEQESEGRELIRKAEMVFVGESNSDGQDKYGQENLHNADSTGGQRVLQSLANDDANIERAVNNNDVGQTRRKKKH